MVSDWNATKQKHWLKDLIDKQTSSSIMESSEDKLLIDLAVENEKNQKEEEEKSNKDLKEIIKSNENLANPKLYNMGKIVRSTNISSACIIS